MEYPGETVDLSTDMPALYELPHIVGSPVIGEKIRSSRKKAIDKMFCGRAPMVLPRPPTS
jgi:hypothetical protein